MLSITNLSKAYADRTLFSGLNLNVVAGERIALIGDNGSGKTTLLDILAGDTSPDTGSISKHRNITIGYLKQEPTRSSSKTLIQDVLEESSEVRALRKKIVAIHEALSSDADSGNRDELLDEQACHDCLAGSRIVRQQEAKRLPGEHLAVHGCDLMRKWIDE